MRVAAGHRGDLQSGSVGDLSIGETGASLVDTTDPDHRAPVVVELLVFALILWPLIPLFLICLPWLLVDHLRGWRKRDPRSLFGVVRKLGGVHWEALRRAVSEAKRSRLPVEEGAHMLTHGDWGERLAAWHGLVARGEEATSTWLELRAIDDLDERCGRPVAEWVEAGLEALADDAPAARGREGARVCRECLVPFEVVWKRRRRSYRACPRCHLRSTAMPGGAIVVRYDRRLGGRVIRGRGQIIVDGRTVPEHVERAAGRIELVDATPVEIEALAIRFGNRDDPWWRRRSRIRVLVDARTSIEPASRRILVRTFGAVGTATPA